MRNNKILFDVEIYKNCFLCSIKDYDTKEITIWEISKRKNDFKAIKEFFDSFKGFLISFNGVHYDNPMILWLLKNGGKGSTKEFLLKLKEWSDMLIHRDFWWNDPSLKKYKYQKQWTDIDLFLYWSKMLRLSKKVSLKGLGIQLGYSVIQELPFEVGMSLNSEQIDELIEYNSVHDLGILELLLDNMEKEVKLRSYIRQEYGINCMSMDAPKIASEVLLKTYCDETGEEPWEVRKYRFDDTERLPLPNIKFELPIFQELYNEMCIATRNFSKEIVVNHKETSLKISYGIGGIHAVNKNEQYYQNSDNLIITSDVASLYPSLIINYKLIRYPVILEKYKEVKADRIIAKKNKEKSKDSLLKLILNSTSGLIDNKHSWLYYPEGAMKLRLMGQLILTVTVEKLVIAGFKVLSINTDGAETIVLRDREKEYYQIVDQVGKEFNLIFEHEQYKKIIYQNVNSYVAETKDGKVKQKGLFVEKPELTNSVNFLIIPKALNAYYINGINIEDFVHNHKEIYDFCCSKKVDKSYFVTWAGEDGISFKQQRLNRFYASTKGGYIYKNREGSSSHILKASGVMLYNNKKEKFPDDINYKFYINQINTIIKELDNSGQLLLF
jgi:transcriptional regulator of NAD metabolism